MRQVTRKGLMTVAAATGVLAAASGYAHADSGASGSTSDSPGVLSGNPFDRRDAIESGAERGAAFVGQRRAAERMRDAVEGRLFGHGQSIEALFR